ncbi:MAG: transporter, partial [Verrucomicrobia bacterium]
MQIHVARNGHRMGPFSLEEVNRQLAAGSLSPSDLAWYEGIPNWVALSQVPGVGMIGSVPGVAAASVASASGAAVADSSYGGFWIRLAAYIIDVIIVGI